MFTTGKRKKINGLTEKGKSAAEKVESEPAQAQTDGRQFESGLLM